MKILCLSPHPDDIEFSMGGTLLKLSKEHEISIFLFSDCGIINEYNESIKVINPVNIFQMPKYLEVRKFNRRRQAVLDSLVMINMNLKPDLVFCPCSGDTHQDHRVIFEEAFRAFKFTSLIGYIEPHNLTEIRPNYFIEITEGELFEKINLIALYKSQTHRNYSRKQAIIGAASFYGSMTNRKYCEAFEIIRKFE